MDECDEQPGGPRECAAGRGAESLAQPGGTRRSVPGPSAYLKAKAPGDNSMPEKRGPLEDAKGAAPRDPRDKAKAGLPELQSPAVEPHTRCDGVYRAALPGV